MTAVTWLWLALGVVCAPPSSSSAIRAGGLAAAGRLAVVPRSERPRRRLRVDAARTAVVAYVGAVVGAAWAGGVAIGVAGAVAMASGAGLAASILTRRRESARRRALLVAARLLAQELQAGSRPAAALRGAAELSDAHARTFSAAAGTAEAGGDVGAVLCADADLAGIGAAWHVADVAGVALADVLGRVAVDLDAEQEQRRGVAVALAGARSSALLLAGLPVLGVALGAAMGAQPLPMLVGTPSGRLLCCVGVVLDAGGVPWTQRLMRRAERC